MTDTVEFENYEYFEEEGNRSVGDNTLTIGVMVVNNDTKDAHFLSLSFNIDHYGYSLSVAENVYITENGRQAKKISDFNNEESFYEQEYGSRFIQENEGLIEDISDYYTGKYYSTIESIMHGDYSMFNQDFDYEF